jgi:hypothetical protein
MLSHKDILIWCLAIIGTCHLLFLVYTWLAP